MRDRLRLFHGTWVVVADGHKALLLENEGTPDRPDLRMRQVIEAEADRGGPSDRPAADTPEGGGRTSRKEARGDRGRPSELARFAQTLAVRLREAVETGRVPGLVVVVAPRFLGILRNEFDAATKRVVLAEIDRDLVNRPVPDIQKQLVRSG